MKTEVPKEWEVVKVNDIISLEYGKGLSENERISGMYPVLGSNGIVGYHNQSLVSGPGIVVGRKGTIGKVTWINSDFWPIDTTYYVKSKTNEISLKWLFYELSYINPARFSMSDVVPGLKRELVHTLQIPFPPLPEQQKIADVLTTVDSAIEKSDEIIEKTHLLKRGLTKKLFTKGIGHSKFKQTEIGEIPEEWDVVKLSDIIEIHDSKRIPLSEMERTNRKGPYPYCGANGIIDYIDNYLFDGEFTLLAEDGGSYGRFENSAYIMSGKFWVNNHAHVLKAIKGKTTNSFILFCLNFLDLTRYIVGSTRKKLNQEQMREIRLQLPDLQEQQEIVSILSEADKKIESEVKRKEKLKQIKKGLMNDLLTGKKRLN